MRLDRPHTVIAAAMLVMAAQALWTTPVAAKGSGVPPFCVLTGGPRGLSMPQICRFFDYQECLWAAADLHGNCVVNIDYHGPVSMPLGPVPTPDRGRPRRY